MALAKLQLQPLRATARIIPYGGVDTVSPPPGWLFCDGLGVNRADFPKLFTALSQDITIQTTNASATVEVPGGTSGFQAGMALTAPGVLAANTQIATIVDADTITVSPAAVATNASTTARLIPFGAVNDTTFKKPDLRGRVPYASPQLFTTAPAGFSGGVQNVTLDLTHMPPHRHVISDPGHTHTIANGGSHQHAVNGNGFWKATNIDGFATAGGSNRRAITSIQPVIPSATVTLSTDLRNPFPANTGSTGGSGSHSNLQRFRITNYLVSAS